MIPVKRQDRGPQRRVSRTRAGAFHALVPLGRRLHGGCQDLKLALAQKIMELRQTDADLMLFVVTPHEEQATKWAPYLRDRYFKLPEDCTIMELASHHKTPECEYNAYRKIIDYADMVLAVYDPATARGDAVDQAME